MRKKYLFLGEFKPEEIEKLKEEKRELEDRVVGLITESYSNVQALKALQEQLTSAKEKYAELLERYIAMMERTARINEQRETEHG